MAAFQVVRCVMDTNKIVAVVLIASLKTASTDGNVIQIKFQHLFTLPEATLGGRRYANETNSLTEAIFRRDGLRVLSTPQPGTLGESLETYASRNEKH